MDPQKQRRIASERGRAARAWKMLMSSTRNKRAGPFS
ncbi:hypothetical protein [Massilia sp. GCM10023247]